jgi:tetrahydromethanopterin S-methyltransferase subunit H
MPLVTLTYEEAMSDLSELSNAVKLAIATKANYGGPIGPQVYNFYNKVFQYHCT